MTFREYLNEGKYEAAADEIHGGLLKGAVGKATDMPNYISSVLNDHGLKNSDKAKVIALVKKRGYTGKLLESLNEAQDKVSPKEKEYLAGVMMGHKAKGKYKGMKDDAIMAMLCDEYLKDPSKFNFKG